MLRTNLATRPFYNDRAVRVGIAIAMLFIAALTAYNVLQVISLNARNSEMSQRAEEAELQAADYRQKAQGIRQALNTEEMLAIQKSAQEANALIGRRVFSWTELFNHFERTLPPEVRIVAVEPQVDPDGRMLVAVTVLSRRAEDLSEFMDQLETAGRFREVLNRQEQPTDDGLMRSVLQGYYDPQPTPTSASPQSSESGVPVTNVSPPGTTEAPAPRSER